MKYWSPVSSDTLRFSKIPEAMETQFTHLLRKKKKVANYSNFYQIKSSSSNPTLKIILSNQTNQADGRNEANSGFRKTLTD